MAKLVDIRRRRSQTGLGQAKLLVHPGYHLLEVFLILIIFIVYCYFIIIFLDILDFI